MSAEQKETPSTSDKTSKSSSSAHSEALAGKGDQIGTHSATSFIDKKDKEVVHDTLLGAEDKSHMPYVQ